jgi:hypothetical protein
MSRFLTADPFFRAMALETSGDRIERFAAWDRARYERQMAARPLREPVVDRDPGDEDGAQ